MNVLSLFSGIGGLDLGLERAGMTVVGQVEIDPWCRKVLAKHWPEVPRHDDVRTAADWWGGRAAPDLVCGGFPCQPVSSAGRRLAQDDPRWLWPAMAEVIRQLRPRYALMENVPGLLARGMGDVLGDLAACGYDTEWDCVPASAVGAPHRRDRVWIVAYPWRDRRPGRSQEGASAAHEPGQGSRAQAAGCGPDVADTDHERRDGRPRIFGTGRRPEPANGGDQVAHATLTERRTAQPQRMAAARRRTAEPGERDSSRGSVSDWWAVEPDVGRVASRLSTELDGDLNAHQECITQGRATGIPQTERLRELRQYITATETPSRPERCALCGHPLSAMPCRGACPPWHLGPRPEDGEDLRCLREGLLGLLAHTRQDLLARLPVGTGTAQRPQTLGSRGDRLRGLGNAVVPQVAEHIGRLILAGAA